MCILVIPADLDVYPCNISWLVCVLAILADQAFVLESRACGQCGNHALLWPVHYHLMSPLESYGRALYTLWILGSGQTSLTLWCKFIKLYRHVTALFDQWWWYPLWCVCVWGGSLCWLPWLGQWALNRGRARINHLGQLTTPYSPTEGNGTVLVGLVLAYIHWHT